MNKTFHENRLNASYNIKGYGKLRTNKKVSIEEALLI
jgi:hypothetical protein